MIHTRAAHSDMVDIIKSSNKEHGGRLRGVFHCFAGNESEAQELMKFDNFMFGIGGIVTFKKSTLPQVLKSVIPLERIVLETDSPYMAPVPNRGKRNESAFIKDIAAKIAEIYECALEHVMEQTTQNALKIFNRAQ
jgi:TatD DNase family protein